MSIFLKPKSYYHGNCAKKEMDSNIMEIEPRRKSLSTTYGNGGKKEDQFHNFGNGGKKEEHFHNYGNGGKKEDQFHNYCIAGLRNSGM